MNTTELPVRPDVAAFVARVRELLADLPEEERLELTEGLEADLADQVAEQGGGALGDPEAYARELRAAAGLDAAPGRRPRMPRVTSVPQVLDAVRGRWDEQVARPQVRPVWDVVATLRPAWWVVRAWIAAIAVAVVVPGWYDYGYVWLPGVPQELAIVIIGVCVAVSTLVGMGRVWPGARPDGSRGSAARIVLLALNLGAIVLVPFASDRLQRTQWTGYEQGYRDAYVGATSPDQGVLNRGEQVCNIAAYDAEGQPLVGVQLFDQAGRPLDVRCWRQQDRTVPWVLGDVTRWNVFPLGERDRPARTQEQREDLLGAAFPTPDRATTPAVTNPLVPADAEVRPTPAREKDRDRREREREGGDVSRR